MSRPAHITALDEALDRYVYDLGEAEQKQIEVLAAHEAFLARHAEEVRKVETAQKDRADAYYAAKSCEDAIRKLGFVVLGVRGRDASRLDGHADNFREPINSPADPKADQ